MQAKILRVIQEKELVRVGGTKSISLDVRISLQQTKIWKR